MDYQTINRAWQTLKNKIPNIMYIYNTTQPTTYQEWVQTITNEIDLDPITDAMEDITGCSTDEARKFINDRVINDTWNGAYWQNEAKKIMASNGYTVTYPTVEQDRHGIDLVGEKDGEKIFVQVKPASFLYAKQKHCVVQKEALLTKAEQQNILFMIYDKSKNEWLRHGKHHYILFTPQQIRNYGIH